MKRISSIILIISLFTFSQTTFAQSAPVKKSFKVAGECTMCKKKIEASALQAGAALATWNVKTKMMNVSFTPDQTNVEKIQQGIAAAGYDTPGYKADSSAYNGLEECCRYERLKTKTAKQ